MISCEINTNFIIKLLLKNVSFKMKPIIDLSRNERNRIIENSATA